MKNTKNPKKPLALFLLFCLLAVSVLPVGTVYAEEALSSVDAAEEAPASDDTATPQAAADSSGIIDADALDAWISDYVSAHSLGGNYQDFSVGFCYLATGDTWYYNADVFMYSASLYKVPVSMLMAEREAAGELTQDSVVRGMPLSYWESTALIYSNNDSGHAMVDDLGGTYAGKCSDMTIRFTDLPESYFHSDFFDSSYYTARYMTQVMKTLYDRSEDFPHVIEYMLQAQPDEYFNRTLSQYEVAQKYGAYTEPNGNNNNHATAIIYTPNPIVVTVMTRNVGDYQLRISEVGAYLADYALSLDEKLSSWWEISAATDEADALAAAEAEALAAIVAEAAGRSGEEGVGLTLALNEDDLTLSASVEAAPPAAPSGEAGGEAADPAPEKTVEKKISLGGIAVLLLVILLLVLIIALILRLRRSGPAAPEATPQEPPRRRQSSFDEPESEAEPLFSPSSREEKNRNDDRNPNPERRYTPKH